MENDRIRIGQPPENEPNTSTEQSDANREPKPTPPKGQHPTAPPSSTSYRRARKKYCYTRDPAMLLVAFFTFIAVVVYAIYARQQAISANKTARAAIAQAAIADRTMRVSERPYVQIARSQDGSPIAEWILDKKGAKGAVSLSFQNVGNTPAQRFWTNVNIAGIHSPSPFPPKHLTLNNYDETAGPIIPAHETVSIRLPTFQPDIAQALRSGQIILWGDFEYFNVFNEWCCEPFWIRWNEGNSGKWDIQPTAHRESICGAAMPNVCEPESETNRNPHDPRN